MWEKYNHNHIVNETLKALKRNGFRTVYVENRKKALNCILEEIPSGATVGA
jgi:predicted transcriptional regulator